MSDPRGGSGAGRGASGRESTATRDVAPSGTRTGASGGERERHAAALGALNAAHASPTARENAASNSRVGQIAAYERAMLNALSVQDPAVRRAAVADARRRLDAAANKPVTPGVVARVDALLGLPATPVRDR